MTKNRRAFMDATTLALSQCTSDREYLPLARYLLAQYDARRAARKPKAKKADKASEANSAAVRG